MKTFKLKTMTAVLAVAVCATGASAEDISTKKMAIKDHATDTTKRQLQLQSKDPGVLYSEANNPGANGASVHVWSSTLDLCYVIPAHGELWNDNGKGWKYKNPTTKNQAQISDGKLQVKLRSGVDLDLTTTPQGTVNASVQFGNGGVRYCMTCPSSSATHNTDAKYQAKDCVAAACDAEPPACLPAPTTTTTSSTTTTTLPGTVIGAISSPGQFNFGGDIGSEAADTGCANAYPDSRACKMAELTASQGAAMMGLQDNVGATVTRFWAIDPAVSEARQCAATSSAGATRWVYSTAHLGIGGDNVLLTNATGMLGTFEQGGGSTRNCFSVFWIPCCTTP